MNKYWMPAILFLALTAGCQMSHRESAHEGDHEDNEVKVAFDQVPAPARETLTREAQGAPLASVDMEQDHGHRIYEADAMIGGRNYEIKVDGSGKLLSKKVDNEADEKADGAKGGKEDKD